MTKVFGVGIAGNGSERLAACLRELGYRHAGSDPDLTERVLEAGEVAALDGAALLHDSFAGVPWSLYFRRLDRRFPDARFILEVDTPPHPHSASLKGYAGRAAAAIGDRLSRFTRSGGDGIQGEIVERHARLVQEYFAGRPGKLLVICWAQERSWRRLCEFLGEPEPRSPLPTGRDSGATRLLAHFGRLRTALQSYAQRLFPTEPY